MEFRIYIEFESGRLVCYEIKDKGKKVEKVWELTTIQAEKVATGELEPKDL